MASFKLLQAAPDKDAVLIHQRNDIGNGSNCHEVEILAEINLATPLPGELEQTVANLEDESDAGEVVEGRIAIALWIDEGKVGVGKFRRQGVVIDNDDVDALGPKPGDLSYCCGAAIDGNQELGFVFLRAAFDAVLAEAVAFLHAKRQESFDVGTELAEHAPEQGAGGDAVDVVIAEDGYLFTGGDGLENSFSGGAEIGEEKGIAGGIGGEDRERRVPVRRCDGRVAIRAQGDLGMLKRKCAGEIEGFS